MDDLQRWMSSYSHWKTIKFHLPCFIWHPPKNIKQLVWQFFLVSGIVDESQIGSTCLFGQFNLWSHGPWDFLIVSWTCLSPWDDEIYSWAVRLCLFRHLYVPQRIMKMENSSSDLMVSVGRTVWHMRSLWPGGKTRHSRWVSNTTMLHFGLVLICMVTS